MAEQSIQSKIEATLHTCPALTLKEFENIVEFLVGKTEKRITGLQLENAFNLAVESWQH